MTKCKYCKCESEFPKGYNRNFCDECIPDKPDSMLDGIATGHSNVYARDTIYLKGYGNESVERIKELERRVILPDNPDPESGKTYHVGRLGENGKIEDREPTY